MRRRTRWASLAAVTVAGATAAAVAGLVGSGSAGATVAAVTSVKPATVQLSSPSIPANSPLGKPLRLTDIKFGQQVAPSGTGGGAGQIQNSPVVVDLPANAAQTQLGAALAGGGPMTVTVDLPDGQNGAYLEYVFNNAALSASDLAYTGGPNPKSTLTISYGGSRVTQF
jgi:hypothetical protein